MTLRDYLLIQRKIRDAYTNCWSIQKRPYTDLVARKTYNMPG